MSLKYHFKPAEMLGGLRPEEMGLAYTHVQRLELSGAPAAIETADQEVCLVVLEGQVGYETASVAGSAGAKDMLYVPRGSVLELAAAERAVLMRYGAPAHIDTEFVHLPFARIDADPARHAAYGTENNNSRRDVWHFLGDDFNASRLMMGICRSRTGGWTSWPPHEHGDQREEVYTYIDMGHGFGIQCVYEDMTTPLAVALVTEGDLVSIPRGYHPNVGCPASVMSFVWCMVALTPGQRQFMNLRIQPLYGDRFL
jgi:5-deoxy-glucuronate isomerase